MDNLSNLEQVKSHCSTILKILKSNYKYQIRSNDSWEIDYNTLVRKYKKHSDNLRKLKRVEAKIASLYSTIKKKSPLKSNLRGKEEAKKKKSVKFNENVNEVIEN